MSVRANREELIQKGILLPDPTITAIQEGIQTVLIVVLDTQGSYLFHGAGVVVGSHYSSS